MGTDSTTSREFTSDGQIRKTKVKYFNALYITNIIRQKETVIKISGYLNDSLYGHNFDFYENGQIKKYCYYYGDSKYCSFVREYSRDKQIISSSGNAFVDYLKVDTDSIELFFSEVIYDSIKVFISRGGKNETPILLKKSPLAPMLLQTTIPISDIVLIRTYAYDRNTAYKQNYYDTLDFRKVM